MLTTSHYVSRGDTAFDVQLARYPKGSLSKDLNGLLKVERDNALQNRGAHLVRERSRTFTDPEGRSLPGIELEVDMPGGMKVFRVTCFVRDRCYTLSAGGPASDAALSDVAFQKFVASFKLIASD